MDLFGQFVSDAPAPPMPTPVPMAGDDAAGSETLPPNPFQTAEANR